VPVLTEAYGNGPTDTTCAFANIWTDEILAKHHASSDSKKIAPSFHSIPDNDCDKGQIAAGRERGSTILQAFDDNWTKSDTKATG
jgi:protoheme ferro-lyase